MSFIVTYSTFWPFSLDEELKTLLELDGVGESEQILPKNRKKLIHLMLA